MSKITCFEVDNDFDNALKILDKKKFTKIDYINAKKYVSSKLFENISNQKYYLVRAVRSGVGGLFECGEKNNELFIHHGNLGKKLVAKKTAVVVLTKNSVSDVFVGYSMAE